MSDLTELQKLEKEVSRHSTELCKLADLLESSEGRFRSQVSRDYRATFDAYKRAKLKLDKLKGTT
jgi:hypothetical protein